MKQFENHDNYNCQITLSNGDQYRVYANWLSNNRLHHWQDWHCEAGVTRLYIDKNLKIWSGECQNDFMGSLEQGWQLLQDHSVCRRNTCTGCTDDILTTKWKP